MGGVKVGLDANRGEVVLDGVEPSLQLERGAQVVVGERRVGVQLQGAAVGGDGILEPPLAHQGGAEVVVGKDVIGLKPQRMTIARDCVWEHLTGLERFAQVVVRSRNVGLDPDRLTTCDTMSRRRLPLSFSAEVGTPPEEL